ncbi:MAG: hypothetical protein M0Z48_05635 [Nitrospiraceae bacterium]|nr:hypothetical protein [Nitrospiraceae bacterium]
MKIPGMISVSAFCMVLAIGLAGCGGGGGGNGGGTSAAGSNSNPSASQPGSSAPVTNVGNLGIALIPSDPSDDNVIGENPTSVLQVVHLFDASGNPLSTPTVSSLIYNGVGDFDGAALTPGGARGIMIDGANDNLFFFTVQKGSTSASLTPLGVGAYGRDGDSVSVMSSGDEAVVSLDDNIHLLLVSGMLSGKPQPAAYILLPDYRDGVVTSNDDKVLLARGTSGLTVFAINSIAPSPGPLGGTVSHTFTKTADIPALGTAPYGGEGRDGMAFSPTDSSRAVIIINGASSSTINLLTGLPASPAVSKTVSVSRHVYAAAIAPDSTASDLAIVGTDSGLLLFSGVASGTLTPVGQLYAPSYTISGKSVTLGRIMTLGITIDGKYAAVCDITNSALLVIPISSSGFGAPVGILPGISVPSSDEMMIH